MLFSALLSLAFLAETTTAPSSPPTGETAAYSLAQMTSEICYKVTNGELILGNDLQANILALEKAGITFGIDEAIINRFGQKYSGVLNRATMAQKIVGDDVVVLSDGGALPGCKSFLLSPSEADFFGDFSGIITSPKFGWTEVPQTQATRNGVTKKLFFRRGPENVPYMMNAIKMNYPGTQIKLMTTVHRVPSSVTLPEGF